MINIGPGSLWIPNLYMEYYNQISTFDKTQAVRV
jgi:hypothetical protein